jgi:hypothetical protein
MNNNILIVIIILISFLLINNEESFQAVSNLETYDIIIIAGQSNSVGFGRRNHLATSLYGAISLEDISHPNIDLYCKNGTIRRARHPVDSLDGWNRRNCIVPKSGITPGLGPVGNSPNNCNPVGFSLQFAKDYINSNKKTNSKALIVGCGLGGTGFINPVSRIPYWWRPENSTTHNYIDDKGNPEKDLSGNIVTSRIVTSLYLITKTKLTEMKAKVNPNSKVVAILWHQGESDAVECAMNEKNRLDYIQYINNLFLDLRKDIRTLFPNSTNVPILMGGMCPDTYRNRITKNINQASNLKFMSEFIKNRVVPSITNCKFVSAEPMEPLNRFNRYLEGNSQMNAQGKVTDAKDDNIHFSATSLREFGKRYFSVFNT